ncbi:13893_t:CDS:2 [Cetraspora pellucida]|uniref:13893_t:CDS:1 n=1 Tax=Cetraspora pellucida TaxID=1433469 RepID=A0A9N9C4T8_9GLOM|nr:13893_t:CDS:2 [Cetraspora pellucida]
MPKILRKIGILKPKIVYLNAEKNYTIGDTESEKFNFEAETAKIDVILAEI